MKNTILIILTVFVVLVLGTGALLYFTRLEVTVPSVSVTFTPINNSDETVVYSYCYDGSDLLRGTKFGGYDCSEILSAKFGDVVVIPEKTIVSYWPMSKFEDIGISAQSATVSDVTDTTCSWNMFLYSDTSDVKTQNLELGMSEFVLSDLKDTILEIQCL
jgi:hypothetical protein